MFGIAAAGFHAVRLFRLADRLYRSDHKRLAGSVALINRLLFGVEIIPGATIGHGLQIMHGHGIVIHPRAVVGANVSIYQQVTLGSDPLDNAPNIGDGTVLFPGAKVLGPVVVGEGAVVAANAVVTKDVEPGRFVVGINGTANPSGRFTSRRSG